MLRRVAAGAYLVALTVVSLLPAKVADAITATHAGHHVAGYLVLMLLLFWAGPRTSRALGGGALFAVLWGSLLEGLQAFIPGRAPEAVDFAANAAGVAVGSLISLCFRVKSRTLEHP